MKKNSFGAGSFALAPRARRAAALAACGLAMLIGAGLWSSAHAATSVYLGQGASGSGDGSSCANARAASWFNSGSNWGGGATQINPGTTVRLCGTVSTNLSFQGSGSSSAPITLDGGGATYAGEIDTGANRSWWRIQNVRWSSSYTGDLLQVIGGSNGVIAGNYHDNITGGTAVFLAQYNGSALPTNISVSNNYFRQTSADLGNTQHDLITTEGSTNVTIEGNYLEIRAGGAGSSAHNDAIQTYQKGGATGGPPSNWTIRYNEIVMNSNATNDRSWMMLEDLKGTINIYSNLLLGLNGASAANGIATCCSDSGVVFNIFNNTFVAKNGASNNVLNLNAPGSANLRNNIVSTDSQTALTGSLKAARDHNLWIGSNIPSCSGITGEICGRDPLFASAAGNNFSLLTGSPALGVGVNLGTAYGKAIAPGATWPNPALVDRPASGNWALGAFSSGTAAVTLPVPTNLRITN